MMDYTNMDKDGTELTMIDSEWQAFGVVYCLRRPRRQKERMFSTLAINHESEPQYPASVRSAGVPPVPVASGLRWSQLRVPMSAVHRVAVSSVKDSHNNNDNS